MKKDKVSITDHIKNFDIEKKFLGTYFDENLNENTTIALVWHLNINQDFLNKFSSIRAIVRYGVGYDNIDLELCRERKIIVANTPDYGVDEVSDSSIAMILSLTRKIKALEKLAKKDNLFWLGKELNLNIKRINELSLGIIGLGRIGSSIARKFLSFSKNVGFYDPYLPSGHEKILSLKRYDDLDSLLKNSDIVSINTPLTKETKNLVDENFLKNMKRGSYLINLSRGPIIKNKELILEKLLSDELEGYGTDVWVKEPPDIKDNFYKLWKDNHSKLNSKVIITPHTAYYSEQALYESRSKACKTCLDIINGKEIRNKIIDYD